MSPEEQAVRYVLHELKGWVSVFNEQGKRAAAWGVMAATADIACQFFEDGDGPFRLPEDFEQTVRETEDGEKR